MAAKWRPEAKAKYGTFAQLNAKAKALGGPPAKAKAPMPGLGAGVVGETFQNLAARADGGITTMSSAENTGIQPPIELPGALMVAHGLNVMSFSGAASGNAPLPNSWIAQNGGRGVAPAIVSDAQLLAAVGKYASNGERDAWIFLMQIELANVGPIPPHKISWVSDGAWSWPGRSHL